MDNNLFDEVKKNIENNKSNHLTIMHDTIVKHNSTNRSYVKTFLPQSYDKNKLKKVLFRIFPFLRFISLLRVLLLKKIPLKGL